MNSEGAFRRSQLKYPHDASFVIKTLKKKVTLDVFRKGVMSLLFFIETFQEEIKSQFDQMTV